MSSRGVKTLYGGFDGHSHPRQSAGSDETLIWEKEQEEVFEGHFF